ncbi:hypothetical protein BRADI_1g37646v3 [Brachypodium distachyon]|nr:hypothetical protein BRADI_1g37646v3 [Brachypodium distachyon]PNT75748.1 hypothetical protein BRADI_1g37646v3 [Brachypodium distachyon]PNT75749.1 hypothetical protein BRADI_1g37646v3 [Brachypodium distachyon]PNT75750.1 hypothetical protein BRADI_1g37646v3 [Brachypodium distachyon]
MIRPRAFSSPPSSCDRTKAEMHARCVAYMWLHRAWGALDMWLHRANEPDLRSTRCRRGRGRGFADDGPSCSVCHAATRCPLSPLSSPPIRQHGHHTVE